MDSIWLRIAFLVANLGVIAGTLDRRSLGPRTPSSGESSAMTTLYDFFGAHGAFFVLASLGLALGVADLVQRLQVGRPLFGSDVRPVVVFVQVLAPAPFVIALALQAAVAGAAVAVVFIGVWFVVQALSG